jgi:hypothetical protein
LANSAGSSERLGEALGPLAHQNRPLRHQIAQAAQHAERHEPARSAKIQHAITHARLGDERAAIDRQAMF